MDKEIKAKWVAALRSGDYKQGRLYLRGTVDRQSEARYCCLGVLCVVADIPINEGKAYKDIAALLDVDPLNGLDIYTRMNDGFTLEGNYTAPKTFAQIADYIEENL